MEIENAREELTSLQKDVWDYMKQLTVYNPSIHAIYERLNKIIELLE